LPSKALPLEEKKMNNGILDEKNKREEEVA
jgi:hypothetical protein